jgi:hypothetical protein
VKFVPDDIKDQVNELKTAIEEKMAELEKEAE